MQAGGCGASAAPAVTAWRDVRVMVQSTLSAQQERSQCHHALASMLAQGTAVNKRWDRFLDSMVFTPVAIAATLNGVLLTEARAVVARLFCQRLERLHLHAPTNMCWLCTSALSRRLLRPITA